MIKKRHIAALVAVGALTLSTATTTSAAGFASWPSLTHPGRSYAAWGPRGVRYGNWHRGPAFYGGRVFVAPRTVYYGCPGCYYGGRYYRDDDAGEKALWYGLGVATPLLLRGVNNYVNDY
jgi:hypothetical protein